MLTACGGDAKPAATPQPTEQSSGNGQTETETENTKIKPADLAKAIMDGEYSLIYKQLSPDFRTQVSEADFTAIAADTLAGVESLQESSILKLNGLEQRLWLSSSNGIGMFAAFGENDVIAALQFQMLEQHVESDKLYTKTAYDFPMHGDWFVFWGGTNVFDNYHYAHPSQRYAYDLIQEKDGMSYEGDPTKNESYHAFGQEVVAPADGTVVEVVNDIADNEPVGVMNEKAPAGNVVIIDHGGEYSYLAHLKKGSAIVKVGDQVKRGDKIGEVGNSGNSSEAHMHFQVSDGSDLYESSSIRVKWSNDLEPTRGKTVSIAGK
ncbi:M23 family peptidase [Paenibacillus paeoniae]|uniref:M23 family peptidase n=2 Tax=Paenibacillus paeoniae TaxID=2292705 RepID=A0A371P6U9_9BACL|nr:M23 family peptidase [Paenibacillus paeoniae]